MDAVRYRNLILRSLSPLDLALLVANLEPVNLPFRFCIEAPNTPIDNVYFIETGIASAIGFIHPKHEIEVGIFGLESITGIPVVLGSRQAPHAVLMQLSGRGFRLSADALRSAMDASPSMQATLMQFVQTFMVQIRSTALANGRSKLEARLARWLLMVHDRSEGSKLRLTHDFLAVMLGVHRPGITVAIQVLEGKGLLRATRGLLHILNRPALLALAGDCYGLPEEEYLRLMGLRLSR